ncbi:MAG: trigger factor [Candidatus Shapirobacteria bacterium]|nr:trigger factor [Candidatus Shapirobacteria bacterium]
MKTDKSFTLTFTFTPAEIASTKTQVLAEIQKNFSLKGFRPGKVPLDTVETNTDPAHLIEHILTDLLNSTYPKKLTENKLHPIIDPKISILNPPLALDKDWQIKVESCEIPEITINPDYQPQIKAAKTQDLNKILDILIKNCQVELPPILLETELNRQLSKLVDQTQQAGLSLNDYLKSKNLNLDQYKDQAKIDIQNEWTINLAISRISVDQKLAPTEVEINQYLEKQPQFKTNPSLANYIVTQQKVIDFLKSL